ncbi:histidine--tRNA ligase [Mucilaginibacter psychrotolerans]|nr:histidine--tRNA ligase [Mucilaginibacter psychrotolerans]
MSNKFQIPRGTMDYLPDYFKKWKAIEKIWRETVYDFGFNEIQTPMFEHTELFTRTAGETSDIVSKELYTFMDRGGRSLSLRPEGTSPVVRAYLENNMSNLPQPVKLFYLMPMFRYERPQAGRYRQHTQYGVEVIGSPSYYTDAEVINMAFSFYKKIGFEGLKIQINSLGDKESRQAYRNSLVEYFNRYASDFNEEYQNKLQKNPLRILDTKEESLKEIVEHAPKVIDFLSGKSQRHFDQLLNYLTKFGIPYNINNRLVRGLDYYNDTVFEVVSNKLGAQDAIAGGGRYDGLIEQIGGKATAAFGFGAGMERLLFALEKHEIDLTGEQKKKTYIVTAAETAKDAAIELINRLRDMGISCDIDPTFDTKVKRQIGRAVKLSADFVIIIGDEELDNHYFTVKDLHKETQQQLGFEALVESLR